MYTQCDPGSGRVSQEWFMAEFLVPWTEVADVSHIEPEATLLSYPVPHHRPSGARWCMHYTNIQRALCLAGSHPVVDQVTWHNSQKQNDRRVEAD